MAAVDIEKLFDKELVVLKNCQKEMSELVEMRQQLEGLLNENKIVKEELALLKPSGEVYKLVGPVLLRQDLAEAKENVDKRLTFIKNEAQKIDSQTESLSTKEEESKGKLNKLQQQYVALQQKE